MQLQQRINAFAKLGGFLGQFSNKDIHKKNDIAFNDLFYDGFKHQIKLAEEYNGWFSEENILFALNTWSNLLNISNINAWIKNYNFNNVKSKKVAIIMAGNIPLVGFHDFISVLISGHDVIVKQSSNDKRLLPFLTKYLEHVEPEFKNKIQFTEDKLDSFDAVIATGSNNTARYFEYYFRGKPSIIRKNRNSVAVLTGNESKVQLKLLSNDIFRYYGLGCRNVSKLFVPEGYNFDSFFEAVYHWHPIVEKAKYANNYDYNKAVYLMSEFDMLDNGFLILKEDSSYSSPIATIFYENYNFLEELNKKLDADKDHIQCVVSENVREKEIGFGETQKPQLWDYADEIDIIEFLLTI
ncbi:acyl-CoA reductase [Yeosuana sp. MJ-SS3]|uniref:Acyl-CoA reductase n=1 Tax=Gilvirhabdus luticola TaxID=3079858 RepID=A0ABU3U9B2_9FLAO|nr:acyl-CoA reductase [Yeosuana sp. MJ-SS3]MDU8886919.1 acyl-CoA reductase [Yeosuana sp. MJ-SS3]